MCTSVFRLIKATTLQTMWNSMTFPWRFAALLPMLNVTHSMPVLVLLSVMGEECNSEWSETKMKCTSSAESRMDANMQLTINSFRPLFPEKIFSLTFPGLLVKSLTFPWQLSNSLTFPGIPDKLSPCLMSEKLCLNTLLSSVTVRRCYMTMLYYRLPPNDRLRWNLIWRHYASVAESWSLGW